MFGRLLVPRTRAWPSRRDVVCRTAVGHFDGRSRSGRYDHSSRRRSWPSRVEVGGSSNHWRINFNDSFDQMDVHHMCDHHDPSRYHWVLRRSWNYRPAEPLHFQRERSRDSPQTSRQGWTQPAGKAASSARQRDHDQQTLLDRGPRRYLLLECWCQLRCIPVVAEKSGQI